MIAARKVPILIVDDRPENLRAMEAVLADMALELVTVQSGNEALGQTLKQDFALVLLDVQMPEMDGFETAEWLRTNPKRLATCRSFSSPRGSTMIGTYSRATRRGRWISS